MCGIAGAYRPIGGSVSEPEVLRRMAECLRHRGPDDSGLWREREGRCGMAHRRLSIIDLSSKAAQPMASSDGAVVLAFNGEIYNHAELRRELEQLGRRNWQTDHSDTEVFLRCYEEWGVRAFDRFQGMFAGAIFDARDPRRPFMHLVRDRLGVKPLYLARTTSGEWLFASEIRALLVHPDLHAEIEPAALWHYLTFIVAPAPLTMFRGIFKLPAGYRVSIDSDGCAQAYPWWDCKPDRSRIFTESELGPEEATDALEKLLWEAIERRMVADVPVGVLLSGGVDSSLNAAMMSRMLGRSIRTFTIGYAEDEASNEFGFAQQVSRSLGTEHVETRIDSKQAQDFLPQLVRLQDEPIADNVCIPLYFLAELVRRNDCSVVHVGEGADEQFLGYWWCQHYLTKQQQVYQPARSFWASLRRRLLQASPLASEEDRDIQERALRGEELFWGGAACWWGARREQLTPDVTAFQGDVSCPVVGLMPPSHATLESHEVVRSYLAALDGRLPDPEVLYKIPYMELKLRLSEHLLMRVDKLTMAHSVEARVPYLDHELVEFSMRVPAALKLRDGTGKWLLKRVAEKYLDPQLVYRKKQGFGAPIENWFRDPEFGKRSVAAFERSEFRKLGFLHEGTVMDLLRQQTSGGGGYSFQLWTILNAVLWHESWVMGRVDCF